MLETLKVTLYAVVVLTLVMNIITLLKESRELKANGKTPLTFRNMTTVFIAAAGEALFVFALIGLVFGLIGLEVTLFNTGWVFVLGYIGRNAAAYLVAWLTWEVFVRVDKRKMKQKIEEDQEAAL
jgi:hypothetical protein